MLNMLSVAFVALAFAQSAAAASLTTTIESVDVGINTSEDTLVFAHSEGRVLRVKGSDKKMIHAFQKAKKENYLMSVSISEEGRVLGASLLAKAQKVKPQAQAKRVDNYTPTVISSEAQADEYFWEMRTRWKRWSQCFNRAHVWAYEMWNSYSIKSMKVFLFFTKSYIRAYNYKWWFHVAPYVMVNLNGKVTEMTMDRTFTDGSWLMKDWTDFFMENKANCPTVTAYSQYENNQYTESCYLLKVPMYYWQPSHLEEMETAGTRYTTWDYGQINTARRHFW